MKIWLTQSPVQLGRIFFSILFFVQLSVAQKQEVFAVRPVSQTIVETAPGKIIAATFRVTNLTPQNQTYAASIVLPIGWKQVTREFPFEIQAGEADVRLISFSIPPDAQANRYEIRYKVRNNDDPELEMETSLSVQIVKVAELELKPMNSPRFCVAGKTFSVEFLLTNLGNALDSVRLRSRSSYDYSTQIDSSVVHLSPRESREIKVKVITEESSTKLNHSLELEARSGQNPKVKTKTSSVVDIIPHTTKPEIDYLEYPVSVRMRGVGERDQFAPQLEVNGYGSLNEKKTDRLEFLIRTRETQSVSVLGQRDEYKIGYRVDNLELVAGDQNYALSPLTEMGRYATGIGARTKYRSMSTGGFYNTTRWGYASQKEFGGFFNYQLRKEATLGLNYLSKREQFNSDIVSFRGLFIPLKGNDLDLEFGTSTKDGARDNAYSAQIVGNQRWISYDLRYVKAGPEYSGYYRDINFLSASLNVQPKQNWRIQSYIRRENRNLARDTNLVYAPHNESYQIGAGYSDFISVNYLYDSQRDQFDSSKYNSRNSTIQTRVGYNLPFVNLSANFDFGGIRDELHFKNSPYKRYALYASTNLSSKQNYNISLEYTTNRDIYTGEDQQRLAANLSAGIQFGESTQAHLNVYGSRLNANTTVTYSMFDATLEHVLPFKHKMSLHGRLTAMTPSTTKNDIAYALEYAIPIDVPIRRITGVGQLRGSIVNERGIGIKDALINVGDRVALTDKDGSFYFASLNPGSVYLIVDKASIGLDRITTHAMPMELVIRGGEETKLKLSVIRSAKVTGYISLLGKKEREFTDTSSALVELGGKSGVFLEMSQSGEVLRRVTDSRGRFQFTDLRPGNWVLKVVGGDIPENHSIDPEYIDFQLNAGDKKDTTIILRPRKRAIRMLQEGAVLQVVTPEANKPQSIPAQTEKQCVVSYSDSRKGYVLQIASLASKSAADKFAQRAESISGREAYIEPVSISPRGMRYRVFIGVFNTNDEAVAFCRKYNFE